MRLKMFIKNINLIVNLRWQKKIIYLIAYCFFNMNALFFSTHLIASNLNNFEKHLSPNDSLNHEDLNLISTTEQLLSRHADMQINAQLDRQADNLEKNKSHLNSSLLFARDASSLIDVSNQDKSNQTSNNAKKSIFGSNNIKTKNNQLNANTFYNMDQHQGAYFGAMSKYPSKTCGNGLSCMLFNPNYNHINSPSVNSPFTVPVLPKPNMSAEEHLNFGRSSFETQFYKDRANFYKQNKE